MKKTRADKSGGMSMKLFSCSDVWEGQTDAVNSYLTPENKVIFMKRQLSNLLNAHLKVQSVLCNPFNQINTGTLEWCIII